MIKTKFALFIDAFFISLIASLTLFLWVNKITENAIFVRYFSFFVFILLFVSILQLFYKSNNKKLTIKFHDSFLQSCLNQLIISSNKEYVEFLAKLLNCTHIEKFLFKLNENFLYINIKTELSSTDYFEIQECLKSKSITPTKLYFIYKEKNKSFDDIILLSNYDIILIHSDTLLKIMSTKNIFPIEKSSKSKDPTYKKIIKNLKTKSEAITKKHFKELFFSGISLLFLSLITPFSNYYLTIGSILVLISIVSLFRKNYSKPDNSDEIFF